MSKATSCAESRVSRSIAKSASFGDRAWTVDARRRWWKKFGGDPRWFAPARHHLDSHDDDVCSPGKADIPPKAATLDFTLLGSHACF